jgi:SAM-dependent methyltransferase
LDALSIPLALERFSGQVPERIVITDGSAQLLSIAETQFHIPGAEYRQLDVRSPFPFDDASFDLILATMVFNEVSTGGLRRALVECRRVLRTTGILLMTITHPEFVVSLDRRNQLKKDRNGILTMPGSDRMRLPIVPRRMSNYERLLKKAGFTWEKSDIYMTDKVLREKPGLRSVGNKPLGLVLLCQQF